MITLEASYRIVTPMFIGDAEQKATDLRPPSIKGALRFWWRALNWQTCFQPANGVLAKALHQLHEQEKNLFGLAARDEGNRQVGGQGAFILQVSQQPQMTKETIWPQNNTGSGYLGYGLMESGKANNYQAHRQAITANKPINQFTLSFIFKPKTPQASIDSLQKTLKVWGLLGGLGSRARRGFGSVSLLSLNYNNKPETFDYDLPQYANVVKDLLRDYDGIHDFPPYSAFCQQTRFEIIENSIELEACHAHNVAGELYKNYRGEESDLWGKDKIPFGLPLANADTDNRRSSPLFFHIHPLKEGYFVASVLYLPAEFHYKYQRQDLTAFYHPVSKFMDSLNS